MWQLQLVRRVRLLLRQHARVALLLLLLRGLAARALVCRLQPPRVAVVLFQLLQQLAQRVVVGIAGEYAAIAPLTEDTKRNRAVAQNSAHAIRMQGRAMHIRGGREKQAVTPASPLLRAQRVHGEAHLIILS